MNTLSFVVSYNIYLNLDLAFAQTIFSCFDVANEIKSWTHDCSQDCMYEQCVDKDRDARYSRRDTFNWKTC